MSVVPCCVSPKGVNLEEFAKSCDNRNRTLQKSAKLPEPVFTRVFGSSSRTSAEFRLIINAEICEATVREKQEMIEM